MNEHSFVKAVHRHLPKDLIRWKIRDTFTGGVPDAYYCGPSSSLFVEYKFIKLPKRPDTIVKLNLSALQLEFLGKLNDFNQPVAVIAGFISKNNIFSIFLSDAVWTKPLSVAYYSENKISVANIAQRISTMCQ